jgi:tripartite-type tricarboxylate transporter receptor subunit TctC
VERLNREVNKTMEMPKVRDHLAQEMVQTRPMSPEQMTAFMKGEVDKWVPVVKAMNIQLQ